jgi:hypothetical protein
MDDRLAELIRLAIESEAIRAREHSCEQKGAWFSGHYAGVVFALHAVLQYLEGDECKLVRLADNTK